MAQEHQEYIQQKVNPILENLVTQLLLERPEHLAPFMIKWLSEHAKTPAAAALTEGVNELNELKAELERLQEEVKLLEAEVGEKAAAAKNDDDDDKEEEDEEDDEDDTEDVPLPPPDYMKRGPRASVSAEAYGQWNKPTDFTPPVYAKSEEQKARITTVLQDSFLFAALDTSAFAVVVDAMQETVVEKDDRIINQGDDGDCLFVVEAGRVGCYKRQPDGTDKLVKECQVGDAFGELALLYNCPRAASVAALERSVLWRLDRGSFNHIVKSAAARRRERYEEFLKSVPILRSMEAYERSSMCDALQSKSYAKGDVIVRQGDAGDSFFIVEEGECVVQKVYAEGTAVQEVMQYKPGDYFGELALLTNEPRAASVVAKTDCRLLTLSRKTFKRLLGSLEDMLKRNAAQYA